MRRINFQKVAQLVHELASGFSIRVHRMTTGKSWEMSVVEKKPMPGKFGLLHTQPPAVRPAGPYVSEGNPGG